MGGYCSSISEKNDPFRLLWFGLSIPLLPQRHDRWSCHNITLIHFLSHYSL